MEDEIGYDLGTGMTVITIIFEQDCAPRIELAGCNPLVAAGVFRLAAETLEGLVIAPTILNYGDILASEESFIFELDEDDEL